MYYSYFRFQLTSEITVQHVERSGDILHVQNVHVPRSHAQERNVRLWQRHVIAFRPISVAARCNNPNV